MLDHSCDDCLYRGHVHAVAHQETVDQHQSAARLETRDFLLSLGFLVLVGIGAFRHRIRLGVGSALAAGVAVIGTDVLKRWVLDQGGTWYWQRHGTEEVWASGV